MKTTKFDSASHLQGHEVQSELIAEAIKTGNPVFIAHALRTVFRAISLYNHAHTNTQVLGEFKTVQNPDDIASHEAGEEGFWLAPRR